MRIVRTRSIPNVEDARLLTDAGRIHDMIHTPDGIRAWSDTRRGMIDMGLKGLAITTEIHKRGLAHPHTSCRFCVGSRSPQRRLT